MDIDALTDEELMVMYQTGSEEAFQLIYRRHSTKIYGFLRSRVWNDERASEIYQDVFLKIHHSKHLYNKSLPVLPWIFSITKSVLVDGLRVDKKAARDSESVPSEISDASLATVDVKSLLPHLPDNQRQAVELRYVDEKTFDEIATALDTTSDNARKIVSRAVAKLRSFTKGTKP